MQNIDKTILILTVSDCGNEPIVKEWNFDARVNHNFEISTIGPLKNIFSRVIVYDYLKQYVEVGVRTTNKGILNIVEKERPDYVLWSSMAYEVMETTFDKIRQFDTKILGWFFDDEFCFETYSKWWIPHLDYCLTTDEKSVQKYTNFGGRAIHFLMYSNPRVFRHYSLQEKYTLSFVGTKFADREDAVNNIRTAGFSIETFGRGWDSGYITIDRMIEIYNTTRINLCFMKSCSVNTRPQFKCKIFDICMCGGFLLCEYVPGIEDYYEPGKEIVCFYDLEDAKEKIRYYLENDKERKQIAEAGYRRAIRDYDAQNQLFSLFKKIIQTRDSVSLKKPLFIKKRQSIFHIMWAKALMSEDCKSNRWRDEILLALSYYPFNVEIWYHLLAGYLPLNIRKKAIKFMDIFKLLLKKILNFKNAING